MSVLICIDISLLEIGLQTPHSACTVGLFESIESKA